MKYLTKNNNKTGRWKIPEKKLNRKRAKERRWGNRIHTRNATHTHKQERSCIV